MFGNDFYSITNRSLQQSNSITQTWQSIMAHHAHPQFEYPSSTSNETSFVESETEKEKKPVFDDESGQLEEQKDNNLLFTKEEDEFVSDFESLPNNITIVETSLEQLTPSEMQENFENEVWEDVVDEDEELHHQQELHLSTSLDTTNMDEEIQEEYHSTSSVLNTIIATAATQKEETKEHADSPISSKLNFSKINTEEEILTEEELLQQSISLNITYNEEQEEETIQLEAVHDKHHSTSLNKNTIKEEKSILESPSQNLINRYNTTATQTDHISQTEQTTLTDPFPTICYEKSIQTHSNTYITTMTQTERDETEQITIATKLFSKEIFATTNTLQQQLMILKEKAFHCKQAIQREIQQMHPSLQQSSRKNTNTLEHVKEWIATHCPYNNM